MADIFLKLGDIDGESTDGKHPNWIEIDAYSFGIVQGGSALTLPAERPTLQDVAVVKVLDKSTPLLFLKCATGEHIPDGTLTVRKAGGSQQDFFIIKMSDLIVSGVSPNLSSSGEPEAEPTSTESVSFNFSKIELTFVFQDAAGGTTEFKSGWDLKKNQKV
jgi:type VI secretion system secreted protein Hcp